MSERVSDCHACHAKAGTPGRTSDPLAVHIVPRLPRKRGGAPGDARAYIRPLGSAHCPTPATEKRRNHACHAKETEPQGTPGRTSDPLAVHICTLSHSCHAKAAEPQGTAFIRPLGSAHCPLPATQKRRSPKGRQGVHPTPWQCTLSHACHAKEAEPQGTPGRTSDPLAVHIVPRLTPWQCTLSHACTPKRRSWQCTLSTPATPKRRSPKGRQGVHPTPWQCTLSHACQDARAYIGPLGSAHCPTPATQKRRSPGGRQGVHPTPWQCTLSHACHAKEAEPQGTARAYIRPLGSAHCPTPATQKRRSLKGRQGVHRTPQGTPDVHRPLGIADCPTPATQKRRTPRDARAYIRPLGSADCPLPATQKRRSPKGRQGVHPTPWQCRLSHACHAKEVGE